MNAPLLILASAAILLLLGTLHLVFTFHGPRLRPRDPAVEAAMRTAHLGITRETTLWNTWIGFNASHSMGAMLFGLVYGHLALAHPALLLGSPYLLGVGLAMLLGFFVLGRVYWFSVPFTGISISLACYLGGMALHFLG